MRAQRLHARLVAIALMVMFVLPLSSATTDAQEGVALPLLTGAQANTVDPCLTHVYGKQFSPGGRVFVAVLDPWGERLLETRWTRASEAGLVLDQSGNPTGYTTGGVVYETFDGLCGQQVMIRAYDQATDSWSNVIDVLAGNPG